MISKGRGKGGVPVLWLLAWCTVLHINLCRATFLENFSLCHIDYVPHSPVHGKYCGTARCVEACSFNGSPIGGENPEDAVDACCQVHACCYKNNGRVRLGDCHCDRALMDCVSSAVLRGGLSNEAVLAASANVQYYTLAPCTCWFEYQGWDIPSIPGQAGICPVEAAISFVDWLEEIQSYLGAYLASQLTNLLTSRSFDCADCVSQGWFGSSSACSSDSRCHTNANTLEDLISSDFAEVFQGLKKLYDRIKDSANHEDCINCIGPRTVGVDSDAIVQAYEPIHDLLEACSGSEEQCMECAADPSQCGSVPYNDLCVNTSAVLPMGSLVSGTTEGASSNSLSSCNSASAVNAPGVWYTVEGTGHKLTATTCTGTNMDKDFDSQISVWEGGCSSLRCVAGNDDGDQDNCGTESRVTWSSVSGRTYRLFVHGHSSQTGTFGLTIRPGNDRCIDAEGPLSLGGIVEGSTVGAITSNLPQCGTAPASTSGGIWYWVSGTGQEMKATTCTGDSDLDGDFDSVLSVWEGVCASLTCVTGNDDGSSDDCGSESTATWQSNAGQTYFIHIRGFDTQKGAFGLVVNNVNDGCTDALGPLTTGQIVEGSTAGGITGDAGSCGRASAQFTPGQWWTISGTGNKLVASTCTGTSLDGDFDSQISVFEGSCQSLKCVAGNNDDADDDCGTESTVEWESRDGRLYYILVHGNSYASPVGEFGLVVHAEEDDIDASPFPGCDNAIELTIDSVIAGTNLYGYEDNLPSCHGSPQPQGKGVWYKVTGTGDDLTASTCTGTQLDGDFDSLLSVWEGSCSNLSCKGGDDDGEEDDCGSESTVHWSSEDGQIYYIHVHGFGGSEGSFGIVVRD